MITKCIFVVICWIAIGQPTDSARILGIFPHFGITHWYVFRPLMEELAVRGHQVTILSPFPRKTPLKNYEDLIITDPNRQQVDHYVNLTAAANIYPGVYDEAIEISYMAAVSEATLEQKVIDKVAGRKFDVAIAEFFNTDVYQSLAYKIGVPMIGFSSCQVMTWTIASVASPEVPAIATSVFSSLSTPLSFYGRLVNVLQIEMLNLMYRFIFVPQAQAVAEKKFGPIPSVKDLAANTSIVFVNTHFTLNGPRPWNPNIIEVGGINVVPPMPLPQNFQELLDKSTDGVIYFSMGTIVKPSTLTETARKAFVRVFASLKQTVLWKYDGVLPDKPPNVHTGTWFPQRDLLAHKNVILFISHCGNLGLNEAVHEGVPIICIPVFGDQPYNARCVESRGIGTTLDFHTDFTYGKIKSTIGGFLSNTSSYAINAKKVSKAYQDRPMSPLQTAVYWVEYVIRHQGAYHIRSLGRNMSWYEYRNYDVYLLLHAILLIILYAAYKCVICLTRCLLSMCTSPRPKIKTS